MRHAFLLTPQFLALVHRSLVAGGLAVFQTDNRAYWQYLQRVLPLFFDYQEIAGAWPDAPQGRTRREIYARRQAMRIYRGQGRPRPELSLEAIQELALTAPRPNFDA